MQTMAAEQILGVFAQLAVVIVGLTGIAGVVGSRASGTWQIADYFRFWLMIASGFILLFLALFPIVLHYFSLTPRAVWGWSSAAAALMLCAQLYWRSVNYKRAHSDPRFIAWTWWLGTTLQSAAAIILILNAVGLGFKGTFAPYLLAMFLILALSCLAFVRLIMVAMPRN